VALPAKRTYTTVYLKDWTGGLASNKDTMLTEAIAATQAGDRARARDLLTRLLKLDSANSDYWLWMSAVVETDRERVYCLESVLKHDPTNRAALRGLTILGARRPGEAEIGVARIPRRQVAAITSRRARSAPFRPVAILRVLGSLAAMILVLIVGAAILLRRRPAAPAATLPPPRDTPTFTPAGTATQTPFPLELILLRTPVATEFALTPLALLVAVEPTPTPILGVTPHPNIEAYASALDAFIQGDYPAALGYLDQVVLLGPSLADAHYLRGETLRLAGLREEALKSYDRAIEVDPEFAPAYFGRGLALMELEPEILPVDIATAIEKDPLLLRAYLVTAEYHRAHALWQDMAETVQRARQAGAGSPLLLARLSEAQFNLAMFEEALDSALRASAGDPALLDGYFRLGVALVALERYEEAVSPLQTYLVYRSADLQALTALARALLGSGEEEAAEAALSRALAQDDGYAQAHFVLGLLYLQRGEYERALSEFNGARQAGQTGEELALAIAEAFYLQGDLPAALDALDSLLESTLPQRALAEAYALRALVFENSLPPRVEEAIRDWESVLELEAASSVTQAMAQAHLRNLLASTPTPSATRTPTATRTRPASTARTPSPTPTPSPSITPTGTQ